MKGIYLIQECKQEIEAKIAEIENDYFKVKGNDGADEHYLDGARTYLKEILSSAIILPVEESWYKVIENVENDSQSTILQVPFILKSFYEQGVIIQPK